MNLRAVGLSAPPKISRHLLNFSIDGGRNSKAEHGVGGDGMYNRFYEDLETSLREELVFSTIKSLGHPVPEVSELESSATKRELNFYILLDFKIFVRFLGD